MINRELKPVTVTEWSSNTDEYGQQKSTAASLRKVEMVIKLRNQGNINNPIYIDVTSIGITKDTLIKAGDDVTDDIKKYAVKATIPSNRYTVVLLQEKS